MLQTDLIKAQDTDSRDLLIALHGLGDSMEGYRWLPQLLRMPRLNVLLANAPDAYYGGFSWYDYAADAGPGVERSYRALELLLQDLARKGYPHDRTVMFGFSQGCLMTIETALRYPHLFAGCAGVSGYVHEPERLFKLLSPFAKSQRLFLTHGTDDPLIPLDKVRVQIEQLKSNGIQLDWREYEKPHTIIEPEIADIRRFIAGSLGYPA